MSVTRHAITMSADEARTFDRYSPANAARVASALTCGCVPYVDVFTYARWTAQGRQVRKGETAVKLATYAPVTKTDEATGERRIVGRRPWRSAVFCRHQTDAI